MGHFLQYQDTNTQMFLLTGKHNIVLEGNSSQVHGKKFFPTESQIPVKRIKS
jgi:hypothetical protein